MSGVLLWFGVAVVGGLAALLRWQVDTRVVGALQRRGLPVGTFAVNLTAAALLGLIAGLALTGDALLLLGTALVGTYSTFSTWMLETERLAEDGRLRAGAGNIALSLLAGVACAAMGRLIGAHL